MTPRQQLRTVLVFTKLSTRRFFRDSLALFFGIIFPLIFLAIFGFLNSGDQNISFKVALINQSDTTFAKNFAGQLKKSTVFKVDKQAITLAAAKEKVVKGQIDGIVILPEGFGTVEPGQAYPSGQVKLLYNKSTAGTGQALNSVLKGSLDRINSKFVVVTPPLTVATQEIAQKNLTAFDYTFAGLLGFSIMGIAVFGPANVFPELKKQGVLRRLRMTPIKTWQYFTSTMFSQAATGLIAVVLQFVVAIAVFNLNVVGNYIEILLFTVYSIFMLLGLGLAIGGWAKNERQAQPLVNIFAFPMLFLSGTFFPRYGMPLWLQHVTDYLPLTPIIDGLRLLITEGKHLTDLGPQLAIMTFWFVVIYAVAFRVFRWE